MVSGALLPAGYLANNPAVFAPRTPERHDINDFRRLTAARVCCCQGVSKRFAMGPGWIHSKSLCAICFRMSHAISTTFIVSHLTPGGGDTPAPRLVLEPVFRSLPGVVPSVSDDEDCPLACGTLFMNLVHRPAKVGSARSRGYTQVEVCLLFR